VVEITMKKIRQLSIKNSEAHKLAIELAQLTGESLTSAVTRALRERLVRERRPLPSLRND
jgi:hypothetical protein